MRACDSKMFPHLGRNFAILTLFFVVKIAACLCNKETFNCTKRGYPYDSDGDTKMDSCNCTSPYFGRSCELRCEYGDLVSIGNMKRCECWPGIIPTAECNEESDVKCKDLKGPKLRTRNGCECYTYQYGADCEHKCVYGNWTGTWTNTSLECICHPYWYGPHCDRVTALSWQEILAIIMSILLLILLAVGVYFAFKLRRYLMLRRQGGTWPSGLSFRPPYAVGRTFAVAQGSNYSVVCHLPPSDSGHTLNFVDHNSVATRS